MNWICFKKGTSSVHSTKEEAVEAGKVGIGEYYVGKLNVEHFENYIEPDPAMTKRLSWEGKYSWGGI